MTTLLILSLVLAPTGPAAPPHRDIATQAPDTLLTTPGGRQFLMADLEKRIRRRQREVETLHGIQDKLEKMREEKSHDRAGIRVDADVPIWSANRMTK